LALFAIRFDFRNPGFAGTTMAERYTAALAMCEWADRLGFMSVVLSEHHGSEDGYLPSPLTMAAAIAARTESVRVNIAALVSSFHDPLRVAEEIAVVDLLSAGRLDLVLANGYVDDEFAMFGVARRERVSRTVELVETLREAWTGEPFEYRGRVVRVTPTPYQTGGPRLVMGGSSEAAARRAARLGDGFMPSTPELWDHYRDETVVLGRPDPGAYVGGDTSFFHVADDPDEAWTAIAPYALHEANCYGRWSAAAGTGRSGGYEPADDADALRATGQYRVLTPEALVDELRAKGPYAFALFHPMMGGIPPPLAWQSLGLFEERVLPNV
jgi:alkanesulfonate monooxygenase SsuD/methylene tetrahydromethanopterin reductase-like flavin-dependent oxidoreductase (luciferase family)